MFNNSNPKTNGELTFFDKIKEDIDVIFDVGCRSDSIFLNFKGDVHYFDPETNFIEKIKKMNNSNRKSYFNNFGLGNKNSILTYHSKCQSFIDRGLNIYKDKGVKKYEVRRGVDYMKDNSIESIDFLKIDTEGFEYYVIEGFEEMIKNVKIIQFEYGCIQDINIKLKTVVDYLKNHGFDDFCYLSNEGSVPIKDFSDRPIMANIICFNKLK